jgi:hypothetical protein
MTYDKRKIEFSQVLEYLAQTLDIPESYFEKAEARYQAVCKWLEREGSIVAEFSPVIYPQGSFLLGTVIKPATDKEAYDIDLVCQLDLSKSQITQKQLKDMVGIEIKGYASANNMNTPAKEGRRCWTLEYSDEANFHMDILPSIPENDINRRVLNSLGVPSNITNLAIAITDNTLPNYNTISEDWLKSNPKGFAAWFKERMKIRFEERRMVVAKEIRAKAEDVPEYKVKTTLQRSIQLLKRHRDIVFKNDKDDKPVSMIITTLAAHAYNNEADLYDAMISIVNGMANYILNKGGVSWVPNPVNPEENFADKWREHPEREMKFRKWIKQVYTDLEEAYQCRYYEYMLDKLKPRFGDSLVNIAAAKMPAELKPSTIAAASAGPAIHITNPSKPWGSKE